MRTTSGKILWQNTFLFYEVSVLLRCGTGREFILNELVPTFVFFLWLDVLKLRVQGGFLLLFHAEVMVLFLLKTVKEETLKTGSRQDLWTYYPHGSQISTIVFIDDIFHNFQV